jgi:hypothetical protein
MQFWVFLFLLIVLITTLSVSVYYNYKHGILIIKTAEEIEDALDVLDEKYIGISKILEMPLFYDSPQVKQVHNDIRDCRDSILKVANILGKVEAIPGLNDEKESG